MKIYLETDPGGDLNDLCVLALLRANLLLEQTYLDIFKEARLYEGLCA
jgi:hypothetical protein